jgi:hypothetical protein
MDNVLMSGQSIVESIVDETIDEITGRSSRKWLLVLLGVLVGAALALYLAKRSRSGSSAAAHAEAVAVPEVPAAAS